MRHFKDFGVILVAILVVVSVRAQEPLCSEYLPDQEIFLPNPTACNLFYICYKGIFSIEACPEKWLFSRQYNACVEPEYAECLGETDSAPSSTESTTETDFSTATETVSTEATSETSTETTSNIPLSSETTDVSSTILSSTDISTIISTSSDISSTIISTSSDISSTIISTSTDISSTIISTSTDISSTILSTSTDISSTTPIETTTTTISTTNSDLCIDDGTAYFPHPSRCDWYIECYEHQSYEMACPPKTYFSDKNKKCVDASESECCADNPSACT